MGVQNGQPCAAIYTSSFLTGVPSQGTAKELRRHILRLVSVGAVSALLTPGSWCGYSGKGLGGSSCVNFYLWTRPEREDMNGASIVNVAASYAVHLTPCTAAWERLGNPGWNWENFQRYSRKVERYVCRSLFKQLANYILKRFVEPPLEDKKRYDLSLHESDIGRDGEWPGFYQSHGVSSNHDCTR